MRRWKQEQEAQRLSREREELEALRREELDVLRQEEADERRISARRAPASELGGAVGQVSMNVQ